MWGRTVKNISAGADPFQGGGQKSQKPSEFHRFFLKFLDFQGGAGGASFYAPAPKQHNFIPIFLTIHNPPVHLLQLLPDNSTRRLFR